MSYNSRSLPLMLGFAWVVLGTYWVRNNSFFWDTIQLGSLQAHWYYENHFSHWLLPDAIDSGHPPVFGMYLALVWTIFGKTLPVCHFAMLPFLLGIVFFLSRLAREIAPRNRGMYLILPVLFDPVLAGQSALISPDIVLVFCFLWGVDSILKGKKGVLGLAALGLSMVSLRGMMTVLVLFVWEAYRKWNKGAGWKEMALGVLPYIPAALFAVAFLGYHYVEKGWIGYFSGSSWADSFQRVDGTGFIKNGIVLVWRLLDYGHIFIWLFVAWFFYKNKKNIFENANAWFFLLLITLVLLSPTLLIYKGLLAHRYLLPVYVSLHLLVWQCFMLVEHPKFRNGFIALYMIAMISGNFWIYPQPIANGWDATLAHLPYYETRAEMNRFIGESGIPTDSVGSAFPNLRTFEATDLSGQDRAFVPKDLARNQYILYSNIFNDFSATELQDLKHRWRIVKTIKRGGVVMTLYQRPN